MPQKIKLFFVDSTPSIMRFKPFKLLAYWWPLLTLFFYGSYFVFGDDAKMSANSDVWIIWRGAICVLSIFALVYFHSARWREYLGHVIAGYAMATSVSYFLTMEDKTIPFWGEITRLVTISILLYILAIHSYLLLTAEEASRIIQSSKDEPQEVP